MGRAISAYQAGTIYGKQYRQVLQGDVVDQLVVGALQEGGVNGDHRFQAVAGHAGGEGDAVLFGDADIVIALRKSFRKCHQA